MADTQQIDDGGPVHPTQPLGIDGTPTHEMVPGMSLRDWFAGQAMVQFLIETPLRSMSSYMNDAEPDSPSRKRAMKERYDIAAAKANAYADAMIAGRKTN